MNERTDDRSELFLRFSRRSMIALLGIVVLLGASALSLMLSPSHAFFRVASQASLAAVAAVIMLAVPISIWRRRWSDASPDVEVVLQDEWRRTNMERATRAALIVILTVQYPLVLVFGFLMQLPAPRGAFAMAAATVTLGLATFMTLFLIFDRD
jgi:hypothetical protein